MLPGVLKGAPFSTRRGGCGAPFFVPSILSRSQLYFGEMVSNGTRK